MFISNSCLLISLYLLSHKVVHKICKLCDCHLTLVTIALSTYRYLTLLSLLLAYDK